MPPIGAAPRALITDARLTKADVEKLKEQVSTGAATVSDVQALAARYLDALDDGAGTALKSLLEGLGRSMPTDALITNLAHEPGLMNGTVVLPDAGRNHPAVKSVQRALLALANRTDNAAFMLPNYGADGDYGSETTTAVKAFQAAHGLIESGVVDFTTVRVMDQELRASRLPPIFATSSGGGAAPGPGSMAAAAAGLVEHHAQHYGVDDPWFNLDKNHALPANVNLGGLKGKWKCNLFACNTMVAAGFEPPYYGNRGRGEYPNANQLYKWSDQHAASFGNAGSVRFELRGEVMGLDALPADQRRQKLIDVLRHAAPGDMIIVDHLGGDVADGGHCRVVLENNLNADGSGSLSCAQASHAAALSRDEQLGSFTGEESIWILRPNKQRAGAPPAVA